MAVTADACLVAQRLSKRLTEGDADVFDGVVVVDVQVAITIDVDIDHAMSCDLVHHVLKEGHAGIGGQLAFAIQIDANPDLGLRGVAMNFSDTLCHDVSPAVGDVISGF